jgi:hypothetical protein
VPSVDEPPVDVPPLMPPMKPPLPVVVDEESPPLPVVSVELPPDPVWSVLPPVLVMSALPPDSAGRLPLSVEPHAIEIGAAARQSTNKADDDFFE